MKKTKFSKLGSWLPVFPGFYGTVFEFNDSDIEWTLFDNPDSIDSELLEFVKDNIYDCIDYSSYELDIAKSAVEFIKELCIESLDGIVKDIKFETLESPKEYNFKNDSVNVEFEVDFNRLLQTFIHHPKAPEYLKQRYTSYDGFLSHYPNNMAEWIKSAYNDSSHTIGSMVEFLLLVDNGDSQTDMYYCTLDDIYSGNYIDYDKIIELINAEFTFNKPIKNWPELENYTPIKGGNFSLQLLTGIGLFTNDPENIPETDFYNGFGLLNT